MTTSRSSSTTVSTHTRSKQHAITLTLTGQPVPAHPLVFHSAAAPHEPHHITPGKAAVPPPLRRTPILARPPRAGASPTCLRTRFPGPGLAVSLPFFHRRFPSHRCRRARARLGTERAHTRQVTPGNEYILPSFFIPHFTSCRICGERVCPRVLSACVRRTRSRWAV
jgi:hypothetical protein